VLVAVSLAVWCGSAPPATAQVYNFNFSGSGVSVMGIFDVAGGEITGISGTVSGAHTNGSIGALLTVNSFELNDNRFPLDYDANLFDFAGSVYGYDDNSGTTVEGSLNVSEEATPAPTPGSGVLSYLVLGVGALFINRKRLWRAGLVAASIAMRGDCPPRRLS